MNALLMHLTSPGLSPDDLRRSVRDGDDPDLQRRRGIAGVSLLGAAMMGVVSLLQLGMVRHLPDPPVKKPHFDTDSVNLSDEAFGWGMPDAPLTFAMHGANLALAAAGPADRAAHRPWIPLAATVLAGAQAAVAAKYLFHQMPKVDKAWCPWCVVDALTHFATFALTLPEARRALAR